MLEDEVRLVLEAKAGALIARDACKLEKLIHSHFVYLNASGRSFDKAGYIDAFCTSGRIVFTEQRFSKLTVKLVDGFAVATLEIADQFRIENRTATGRFNSLCVFTRSPTGWRWAAGQTMAVAAT